MLESRIEKRLKKEVKRLGGKCLKFVSPGVVGVPDRIVLIFGRIIFVELKAPGKKLRAIQEYRAKELKNLGFDVRTIDTLEKVDLFIEEMIL